ncbi:MAG: transposase [Anaerolineae bacterium]|nr:transposase [Anaerolineae bacterium]
MPTKRSTPTSPESRGGRSEPPPLQPSPRPAAALPNYTLSTVCPGCGADTYRLACKVRCDRCGFVWDCSEV